MFYAHSLADLPKESWQTLDDHLTGVALMAREFADSFKAGDWGHTSGMGHDLGKYQPPFQKRLEGSKEAVDHSGPGARWIHETIKGYGKLIAYTILGHHGGMPDGISGTHRDLEERLKTAADIRPCLPQTPQLPALKPPIRIQNGFQAAFFTRMLFSCLVDADFLDTERFLNPEKFHARSGTPPLRDLEHALTRHMQGFQANSPINEKRTEILKACLEAANKPPGLFSLTVPTGGGKTLASMAFALKHAGLNQLKRIIYVIPFTSIIEQNADVFRDVLGEKAIIEHHSNFAPDPEEEDAQHLLAHRLASENWDAPVIVTTNVQFFESLFANKPSRCRKLHNIAGSVIILDEAQMLPPAYLEPCLAALKELTENYRASVVLCTATQPALEKGPHFEKGLNPEYIREIIPDPFHFHDAFRRTKLTLLGDQSDQNIADAITTTEQALCIVNTRKRAADIFSLLEEGENLFHLSARMCPAHRKQTLQAIRRCLHNKEACRVVATQLVEAGVDVSFPIVFREMAGLDSICQAAGRCNRNGEMEGLGQIQVFRPQDGKSPKMFRRNIAAAESALRQFPDDPFSPQAMHHYFKEAYWLSPTLDEKDIMPSFEEGRKSLLFPFRTVAEKFRLIENAMQPVLVPWDKDAQKLIEDLTRHPHPSTLLRKLQAYTVQIYPHEFRQLGEKGGIMMINGTYPALTGLDPWYSKKLGLVVDAETSPESFII